MSSPKPCCASGSRLFLVAGAIQFGAACPSGSRPASTPDAGSDAPSDTDSARMDGPGAADVGSADAVTCGVLNDKLSPPGTFKTVAVGEQHHAFGIHTDDTISCWENESSNLPMKPSPPPGTFTRLVAADSHFCGLRSDGQILCWEAPFLSGYAVPAMPLGTAYANVTIGSGYVCGR